MTQRSFLHNQRIVITGGTGFIGSHLAQRIVDLDPKAVRVVSSGATQPDRLEAIKDRIEFKLYKTPENYVKQITEFKPDYIFVLGGNSDPRLSLEQPRLDLEYNVIYNLELFEALARHHQKAKVLYASSIAVYGEGASPLKEEQSIPVPRSPYGINKLACEGYVRYFAQCHGLHGFSVRLSPTYGPGLTKQVIYDFIVKLRSNPEELAIIGDGSEIRDFSYIDDQIDGLLLLAEKAKYAGEVYNLGSGEGISIKELGATLGRLMGLSPRIVLQANKHEKHHGQDWILDITNARSLGHKPKVSLESGLKKTLDWLDSL